MTRNGRGPRWDRLDEILASERLQGFIVSGLPNVRYLTGFTGSSALLLAMPAEAVLFTDGRYTTQARQEVHGARVVTAKGPLVNMLNGSVKRRRLRRLGFERRRIGFDLYQALQTGLPKCRLEPLEGTLEKLRMVKDTNEIAAIRRAVELNSRVFEAALGAIRPGQTERDVAAEIEHDMRRQGGEKPSFDTIVASGRRSALPHAHPTHNPLRKNEFIIVDQGVILDGYSSDMTRTVALGSLGRKAREVYRAVLEAQLAGIAAVRAGVRAKEVDLAARKVLEKHGLEKAFVHSTGHGVGLEIHEPPRLGRTEKTRLEAGMVITIEPGAYLEDLGGVRIEDMVLVTAGGCEVLTPTPKDLLVL
jgi:Xaa-Pro aminopeptidase